ncbi:MAG: PaaI family thioesterase [Alphaproteobacteria bacterium]|nr:PaaI family thioesterase [Alphaproteobacteria bacterium]
MTEAAARELSARLGSIPYAQFLGLSWRLEGQHVTAMLAYRESNVGNPLLPALHGGVIGALLEFSAIVQLAVDLGEGHLPKPINLTVEYRRSGRPVDTFSTATVTKLGRRVANVSALAWQDDKSRPIAVAHGHFLLATDSSAD